MLFLLVKNTNIFSREINILTHIKLNHFCFNINVQEKAEFISNLVG